MRITIETFLGSAESARDTLRERGTRYVAVCPGLAEPQRYAAEAPDGFMAQLRDGRVPGWLEPVPVPDDDILLIWKIRA